MPSQIKVDEIKNVAGQYKIKTNVLEGQTTADSIAIQTGATTTVLQAGIAKAMYNLNSMSTLANNHSLNISSTDDDGTGDFGLHYTSNFENVNYLMTHAVDDGGASTAVFTVDRTYGTNTTAAMDIEASYVTATNNRTASDGYGWMGTIFGDLA